MWNQYVADQHWRPQNPLRNRFRVYRARTTFVHRSSLTAPTRLGAAHFRNAGHAVQPIRGPLIGESPPYWVWHE